jgi:hypothetical protein
MSVVSSLSIIFFEMYLLHKRYIKRLTINTINIIKKTIPQDSEELSGGLLKSLSSKQISGFFKKPAQTPSKTFEPLRDPYIMTIQTLNLLPFIITEGTRNAPRFFLSLASPSRRIFLDKRKLL